MAEPVGVIAPVTEQNLGAGKRIDHQSCALVIAHLAFAQQQHQGAAQAIADRMQLRVQPAFGASDTSGNSPFLSRLAAVRCAFKWVASIISWSGLPPLAAKAAKMRLNTYLCDNKVVETGNYDAQSCPFMTVAKSAPALAD